MHKLKTAARMWALQNLIALDRQGNALTGGSADETLSSRCYRAWRDGRQPGRFFKPAIDWFFARLGDPDHCRHAHEAEARRWSPFAKTDTAGQPLIETIRKGA